MSTTSAKRPRADDLRLLPPGYPYRRRGSCVPAAYLLLRRLPPDAVAVCGYVGPAHVGTMDEHTWVEHAGRAVDPTLRQFRWWRAGVTVRRDEVRRAAASEFARHFEEIYAMPWTSPGAHYRKFELWLGQLPAACAPAREGATE